MNGVIVIPSCRGEGLERFLSYDWGLPVIVVWDGPANTYPDGLPRTGGDPVQAVYPWEALPSWMPRQTDMIRSWGFYRAWAANQYDFIVTLDDDLEPVVGDRKIGLIYEEGFSKPQPFSRHFDVGALTDSGLHMRGFPYEGRDAQVGLQIGVWNESLDLDAITQLANPGVKGHFRRDLQLPIPVGVPVTVSAMNFGFRTELTKHMWQLPLLGPLYNRFGDIWGGFRAKRALDRLGYVTLLNTAAMVIHQRASDPWVNLQKEAPGMPVNETFADDDGAYADSAWRRHYREVGAKWEALFASA